ncbi:MAG: ATP-binding protein, partial [Candidatus Korarchaeum sp.]|nr:ATP-binding protein [Candidatus Korarchaeum sp.]MDW8035729.1 DUF87 domain-containing protein [Candidatus Korarchaeum sp.]
MEKDSLGVVIAIAFPIVFLVVYREKIEYLLMVFSQSWISLMLLATLICISILYVRGYSFRGLIPVRMDERAVMLAKLIVYDKNTSINANRIKEIAESMGIGIMLLVSVDGSRKLMGRSLGRRAGYGVVIWANSENRKEGKEVIRAFVSAINSFSEGFKLEIVEEKLLDSELISSLVDMISESKELIPIELGRELKRSDLVIELGERKGKVIGISPEDLTKHVLVAGQTGSGKTTTVKRIIYETWNMGVPSLIMDSHWEYGNLVFQLGGRIYFNRQGYPQICVNPLASIPKGEKEVFLVTETLSALLDLTPSQFYLLLKALRRLSDLSTDKNPPNMLDLILEVKGMVSSSQPEEESRTSLIRKLEPLISGDGENLLSCDNILSTGFEETLTLLELGDIESDLQKQLLSFFVLKKVRDLFIKEEAKSKFPRL